MALPADWNPTVDHENRCRSLGYDPMTLAAAFKSNHKAKGKSFADWDAAFDLWIGNEKSFAKQPRGQRHDHGKREAETGGDEGQRIAEKYLCREPLNYENAAIFGT